jgi:hypothetical protein
MIDAVTILAAVLAALLATVILTLGFLRRRSWSGGAGVLTVAR